MSFFQAEKLSGIRRHGKAAALISLLLAALCPVFAGDAEATRCYEEGRKLYLAGEYYDAAEKFEECHLLADSAAIRANSLLAVIGAYRMCKLPYREYLAIEKLLDRHIEYADYAGMVKREFELGDQFRKGVREPSFWSLRWIPYLTDIDRTEEIYTGALRRSPYAPEAPEARLYLAYWYEMNGMTAKSLDTLRELLRKHPDSPRRKIALLALGNGLFELAARGGDGDGVLIAEALSCFQECVKSFPDSPEAAFARRKIAAARDVQAAHLEAIAEFYRKSGRGAAAARYFARIMQEFPESASAAKAEEQLVKIDSTYLPGDFPEKEERRYPELHSFALPQNAEKMLLSPAMPKNRTFLLPVPDIKGNDGKKQRKGGK